MLQYYEGIGLMPEAPRTESKRRLYNDGAVDRLGVFRHARELDFEVHVIREMLNLARKLQNSSAKVDALARGHLDAVTSRIAGLQALKKELEAMIRSCAKGPHRGVPRHRRAVAPRTCVSRNH